MIQGEVLVNSSNEYNWSKLKNWYKRTNRKKHQFLHTTLLVFLCDMEGVAHFDILVFLIYCYGQKYVRKEEWSASECKYIM